MSLRNPPAEQRGQYIDKQALLDRVIYSALADGSRRMSREAKRLLDKYERYANLLADSEGVPPSYREFLSRTDPDAMADLLKMAETLPTDQQKKLVIEMVSKAQGYNHRQAYKARLDVLQMVMASRIINQTQPALREIAIEAGDRAHFDIIKEVGIAWAPNRPSERMLKAIYDNSNVSRWVRLSTKTVTYSMYKLAVEGVATGRSNRKVAAELHEMRKTLKLETARVTEKEKWRSVLMARTMTIETAAQATAENLKNAGLKRYVFKCNFDERTCPICGEMDGKIFLLDEMDESTRPPLHPNCRCRIAPAIPDKYKADTQRLAKDQNGKYVKVPANWTYNQYAEMYLKDRPKF